jgi:hypothetical protein
MGNGEELPRSHEDAVQHLLGQPPRRGVLLPQLNVSTPKRASREDGHNSGSATIAPRTKATPTTARNERVTGPGDRAHRREHQPNGVEGKRAGSSGCESWSEVRVQGSHLPADATGFLAGVPAWRRGQDARPAV